MMGDLKTLFYTKAPLTYTGRELRPHYLLTKFEVKGSSLVAFCGKCWVETEHLVDMEDQLNHDHIAAENMVHFLGEFFGRTMVEGVFIQRLFMSIIRDVLKEEKPELAFVRDGDDIFIGKGKLSVSIVTASPVSQLLHVGININPKGAPVEAIGVEDLGLKPEVWVPKVLQRFLEEWQGIQWACVKVRPVI